jgi:hypothetical protein
MKEVIGNVFDFISDVETNAICITTNAMLRKNGNGIMGLGIALECRNRYPETEKYLGQMLKSRGNKLSVIGMTDHNGLFVKPYLDNYRQDLVVIFSFPTKYNWRDKSDLKLIEESCRYLVWYADGIKTVDLKGKKHGLDKIVLPVPGCNNGGLSYENEVRPLISSILDDRFVVCKRSENEESAPDV